MGKIVSNATPLIYLAKAGLLQILHSLFDPILIPEAVYEEVVVIGKLSEQRDAFLIEKAVQEAWIIQRAIQRKHPVSVSLHPGEREVISLALEAGIKTVLMDDAKARTAAELAGLNPRGTVWVMLKALENDLLSFDGFLQALEDITNSGFYLREDIYLRVIREARKISDRTR